MNPRMPWIEHLVADEGLSYPDARRALEGWAAIPFIDENGEHLATLIKRGAEVHFAAFQRHRAKGHITRARLRAFLQPVLDAEGFLTTKLAPGEPDGFIRRLGFAPIGRTASHRIYMLNEIALLGRRNTCERTRKR